VAVPLVGARRLLNLPLNQYSERVTAAITRECAYERMYEIAVFVVFTLVEPNRESNRPLFVANKLLIEVREHLFLLGPARPVDGVLTAPTNFGGHQERLADNVFKLASPVVRRAILAKSFFRCATKCSNLSIGTRYEFLLDRATAPQVRAPAHRAGLRARWPRTASFDNTVPIAAARTGGDGWIFKR
jgi:hypothetical protein